MKMYALAALAVGLFVIGCSSDDTTSPNGNVSVESSIESPTVSMFSTPGDRVQGRSMVDSITVTRVRVLVSRMILRPDGKSDNDSSADCKVKTEPFVYIADSTGTKVVASASVPNGSYDRIKYEIHRFSSSEVPSYLNDTIFRDFVTNDRYTVIIEGTLVRDGSARQPFVYRSDATANVKVNFAPSLTVSDGTPATLSLRFNAANVFRDGSDLLDPEDGKNESKIDNNIKAAFKANKK